MALNLIVAGVGGQGSILCSHIIAEALIMEHGDQWHVRVGETFGAAQRGGAVASHVRAGGDVYSPLVGKGMADLVLALEPLEGLRLGVPYLASNGTALLNAHAQVPVDVKVGAAEYPAQENIQSALERIGKKAVFLDGDALAAEAGSSKVLSIVMLGAAFAGNFLPVKEETLLAAIRAKVPEKLLEANLEAFRLGREGYAAAIAGGTSA